MKANIELDARNLNDLIRQFPQATAAQVEEYTERVGRKLEREAKYAMRADVAGRNQARSRTGNLVRQIRFVKGGRLGGAVKAFANYSKFVHGAPYYRNQMRRKENPFFTTALENAETTIDRENRTFVKKVLKRIDL